MKDFLLKYLKSNPDAFIWVCAWVTYCHAVDDVIDGDKTDSKFILDTFRFAPVLFGNVFYLTNLSALYPLVLMSHDAYEESVRMEKSNQKWQRHYADILRQSANEVILKGIEIVGGLELRQKASLELRELSYKTHHDETGKPV